MTVRFKCLKMFKRPIHFYNFHCLVIKYLYYKQRLTFLHNIFNICNYFKFYIYIYILHAQCVAMLVNELYIIR